MTKTIIHPKKQWYYSQGKHALTITPKHPPRDLHETERQAQESVGNCEKAIETLAVL